MKQTIYDKIENDRFKFIRQKTKDTTKKKTEISILLSPEITTIINDIGNETAYLDSFEDEQIKKYSVSLLNFNNK